MQVSMWNKYRGILLTSYSELEAMSTFCNKLEKQNLSPYLDAPTVLIKASLFPKACQSSEKHRLGE